MGVRNNKIIKNSSKIFLLAFFAKWRERYRAKSLLRHKNTFVHIYVQKSQNAII